MTLNLKQILGKIMKKSIRGLQTCKTFVLHNWWWLIMVVLIVLTTICIFTANSEKLFLWADLLTKVMTPCSIFLGIILGYPLLKKKLTEQYINKQFDVMDAANRGVRHKVIEFQDKYRPENISSELNMDYIDAIANDIRDLRQVALDATPDVYRYINLIFKTITEFSNIYSSLDTTSSALLSKRNIQTWLYFQLHEVFSYSKSIGILPSGETVKRKVVYDKGITPYVSNNIIIEIKDIAHSIDYYRDDAMLVLFWDISLTCLNSSSLSIFKSIYNSIPSPSPLARLLLSKKIYFPLEFSKDSDFMNMPYKSRFQLIGFERCYVCDSNGNEDNYYLCFYSGIVTQGVTDCTIKNISSLYQHKDSFLNFDVDLNKFRKFTKVDVKTFSLQIPVLEANNYFTSVRSQLESKLRNETRQ